MVQIAERPKRLDLHLPVRVCGTDGRGARFEERTRSLNVSATGVGFECGRRLEPGDHVEVEIDLPAELRSHFGGKRVYRARAVVTRTGVPPGESLHEVGARFLGEAGEASGHGH